MNKYTNILTSLKQLEKHIFAAVPDTTKDAFINWLIAAAMRIWSGNRYCAEDYVSVLPEITGKKYTTEQVMTALECAGEEQRQLTLPMFFRKIVEQDVKTAGNASRAVADDICRFLAQMALVNGDFTLEEAILLQEINEHLLAYCNEKNVLPGVTPKTLPHIITPLSTVGYYAASQENTDDIPSAPPADTNASEQLPGNIPPAAQPPAKEPPVTPPVSNNPANETSIMDSESTLGLNITVPAPVNKSEDTLESVMQELNELVGLDKVKKDVQSLLNFIRICNMRTQRGMKVPSISYHLVFTGNPGTGKTTVARLVAKLYYLMGILPQGQLIETDRSGLVAGYLGQTAIKTQRVIQQALGGVLFIDEAYSLANDKEDSYGKEAIETLLKAMEDHRNELVVIVAGYDELMHQFIESNPGLRSRFNKYFHFPDYDGDALLHILERFCKSNGYTLANNAIPLLQSALEKMHVSREKHFGNARAIRNIFEKAINHQANRLVNDPHITDTELMELTYDDIRLALEEQ